MKIFITFNGLMKFFHLVMALICAIMIFTWIDLISTHDNQEFGAYIRRVLGLMIFSVLFFVNIKQLFFGKEER